MQGGDRFLERRAMDDMLDRIAMVSRRFDRALLVGALDHEAVDRLRSVVGILDVVDFSAEAAQRSGGEQQDEAWIDGEPGSYDLVVAAGTLATVDKPGDVLLRLRFLLRPDGLMIGYVPGGNLLPRLAAAMRAADASAASHSPHVHPRLDPAGLAALLSGAGFVMPVVDVDRLTLGYASLSDLVRDLRAHGATNVLAARSLAYIGKARAAAAAAAFMQGANDGRVKEIVEILHFSGWSPHESR